MIYRILILLVILICLFIFLKRYLNKKHDMKFEGGGNENDVKLLIKEIEKIKGSEEANKFENDLLYKDSYGMTLLHYAAIFGDSNAIKYLSSTKIDLDFDLEDIFGRTPLFLAIMNNKSDSMKLLVSSGADVNYIAKNGDTILHYAAFGGNTDLLYYIMFVSPLRRDIINCKNLHGETPLFEAVKGNNIEAVKVFIMHGADANHKNENNETPLFSSDLKNIKIAKLLIESGADFRHQDNKGRTPLFAAAEGNSVDYASFLIDKGLNVNHEDNSKRTPLFAAAERGNIEIAKLLVENGAKVNHVDENGNTPLSVARTNEIEKVLIEHGGRV